MKKVSIVALARSVGGDPCTASGSDATEFRWTREQAAAGAWRTMPDQLIGKDIRVDEAVE